MHALDVVVSVTLGGAVPGSSPFADDRVVAASDVLDELSA